VDGGDVGLGGRAAGANGPDRLVSHDSSEIIRQRLGQLPADHRLRLAGQALRLRLPDAGHGDQPCRQRRLHLGAHHRIRLRMVGAAFGMAEDDMGGAGIAQHGGRDVAGMRALGRRMAILRADGDRPAREQGCQGRHMREGRADQQVGGQPGGAGAHRLSQRPGLPQRAVHLPIACDQGADARGHVRLHSEYRFA